MAVVRPYRRYGLEAQERYARWAAELGLARAWEQERGPAPDRDTGSRVGRGGYEPCLLTLLRVAVFEGAGRGVSLRLLTSLARTGHLALAVELAYATSGEHGLGDRLLELVEAAAGAGDLQGAQALTGSLPDRALHDQGLVALVPAWAGAGERGKAVALAERVRYPHNWGRAWATLAKAEADRGDMRAALEFARRAHELDSTGGGVMSTDVLALVVEVATAAGDGDWAAELADRMESLAGPSGYDRGWGRLHPFARVLACEVLNGDLRRIDALLPPATGAPLEARGAADEPEAGAEDLDEDEDRTPADRETAAGEDPGPGTDWLICPRIEPSGGPLDARVMADLVHAVAESVDHDVALALADRAERLLDTCTDSDAAIDIGRSRGSLLESVTLLLAGRGQVERAMALADRLKQPDHRASRHAQIVGELARHGDVDRAESLALALTDPRARVVALTDVVRGLAGRGDLDRAEALAMSVTDPWDRDEALNALVQGLARHGEMTEDRMSRAEALASSVVHRATRARALASLVAVSAAPEARRLAAQAVVLDGWAGVLDVLEPIVPSAAATVADQLGSSPPETTPP